MRCWHCRERGGWSVRGSVPTCDRASFEMFQTLVDRKPGLIFIEIGRRIDIEPQSRSRDDGGIRSLVSMMGQTVWSEPELERATVPKRDCVRAVPMSVWRESRAGGCGGGQKTGHVVGGQARQVGMNDNDRRCAHMVTRRRQFFIQSPPFIPHPMAGPLRDSGGREQMHRCDGLDLGQAGHDRLRHGEGQRLPFGQVERRVQPRFGIRPLLPRDDGRPWRQRRNPAARSMAACATLILSDSVVINVAQWAMAMSGASHRSPLSISMASISPA